MSLSDYGWLICTECDLTYHEDEEGHQKCSKCSGYFCMDCCSLELGNEVGGEWRCNHCIIEESPDPVSVQIGDTLGPFISRTPPMFHGDDWRQNSMTEVVNDYYIYDPHLQCWRVNRS